MVVAEVNAAEPGVLASERSRFHRNGLVRKRKDPSGAGPSDPSQQVRVELVARSTGCVAGLSFNETATGTSFPRCKGYRMRK
jgi:hypothetical protein